LPKPLWLIGLKKNAEWSISTRVGGCSSSSLTIRWQKHKKLPIHKKWQK
jgi:hypothetical protein